MADGLIAMHPERYKETGGVRLNAGYMPAFAAEQTFPSVGAHASIPPVHELAEALPLTYTNASNSIDCPSTGLMRPFNFSTQDFLVKIYVEVVAAAMKQFLENLHESEI